MEPIRLKTSLFGFKRKQVLQYVNGLCADFQQQSQADAAAHAQQMTALKDEYEEKLRTHEHAISVQAEANQALEQQLGELAASLDEKYVLLENETNEKQALAEQLQQAQQQLETQTAALQLAQEKQQALEQLVADSSRRLADREEQIARQSTEVARLQSLLAELEDEFSALRADAEQSTAMVNCLNLLHGRNRALSQKVARLEAQLEESRAGDEIQGYIQSVSDKQETLKNTEMLFSTVRKEIQDALDSISTKIESGAIARAEDGNYFVDMANL